MASEDSTQMGMRRSTGFAIVGESRTVSTILTSEPKKGRTMAAKLSDVADAAGVSVATASKALNERFDVASSTRERVTAAAERLGYAPNQLARALSGGRTGTVGVVTSDLDGRFVLPIVMGVEDALGGDRVQVFLCDARGDEASERRHIAALLGRQVDGLVIVGSQTDPRTSIGRDLPVPVIYAYATSDDPADVSIAPDNRDAGRIAVEHLVSVGRRRIAHVSGDASHSAATERSIGVAEALTAASLEQVGTTRFGDWTEGWGRAATAMLLDGDPIDAIVCDSDQLARGVLDMLRDRGVAVPSEVAVIGMDNWEPMISGSRPSLSSVDLNLQRLGRRAAARLFAAVDGDVGPSGIEYLACSVVIRESTVARA